MILFAACGGGGHSAAPTTTSSTAPAGSAAKVCADVEYALAHPGTGLAGFQKAGDAYLNAVRAGTLSVNLAGFEDSLGTAVTAMGGTWVPSDAASWLVLVVGECHVEGL
jgi:hypothetical protein